MLWCPIPTLHSAGYDTSYTECSLSGLWAIEEVHKLLVCSSTGLSVLCVSTVSLEIEMIVTDATVLQRISYILPWIYSCYKRERKCQRFELQCKAVQVKGRNIQREFICF